MITRGWSGHMEPITLTRRRNGWCFSEKLLRRAAYFAWEPDHNLRWDQDFVLTN